MFLKVITVGEGRMIININNISIIKISKDKKFLIKLNDSKTIKCKEIYNTELIKFFTGE